MKPPRRYRPERDGWPARGSWLDWLLLAITVAALGAFYYALGTVTALLAK